MHQQHDRSDERHGDERADGKAEDAVELQFAEPMAYDRRHEQHADERGQQPGRPNDERSGQRKVNRGDRDKSQYRLPARFRLVNMTVVCLHRPPLITRTEATRECECRAGGRQRGTAIWRIGTRLSGPAGSAEIIVYRITMLSEASYSRTAMETAVRSRDWSTRSFASGVATPANCTRVFSHRVQRWAEEQDRSALFRWFALPVSTLLLVDGLAGGLAECGHE